MKRLIMATTLTAVALATVAWPQETLAQSPADHGAHQHSQEGAKAAPTDPAVPANPPAANAPQGGVMGGKGGAGGGMPMMGEMKNMMSSMSMMNTMGMMQSMRMMGGGIGGMATIDYVEGRIAFLKAELKVTDSQAEVWNGFADALRANASRLGEIRGSMAKPGTTPTLADRLDRQEQWLSARLEGTKAIKTAFIKLNETLSDEQKKTANDLLAPHMGMATMAMMPTPAQPGERETRGMPAQRGPMQAPRN